LARGSNEVGENDELDLDSVQVQPDQVYNPDQLFRLFEAADSGFDQTVLMTIALTMVRHGEALGLMWRDVDFDTKELADPPKLVRSIP
jgi:integrase